MAADLECRLECGCRVRFSPWGLWFTACSTACDLFRIETVTLLRMRSAISVGYALAASRGLGPWAERWPG